MFARMLNPSMKGPIYSVDEGEVLLWADARRRVATVDWAAVVGVRASDARDTSLFRVLEWGAIEVL